LLFKIRILAYILNIETATKNCSVSIANDGKTIALKELSTENYSHAEKLHEFINLVIKEAKIELNQLDAVAVSKGPGSYTGLRIGVSAVKGLCFALDVPLISINTLEILATAISQTEGFIIPLLDARRMEVYSSVFNFDGTILEKVKAEIIDENSFIQFLEKGKASLIGDGVEKCKGVITHENAIFIDDKLPSANEMSKLSYDKFKKNDIEDVAYFEPFYLKDFVAIKSKK
jgi:tRNA threonylcarbamoyladenosine biosynthesis protein TsaB